MGAVLQTERKIIEEGLTDPDKIRGKNGTCFLRFKWTNFATELSITGKVYLAGFWFNFDAGAVKLSTSEMLDLLKSPPTGNAARREMRHKRRVAFRKRISISADQYEHLLRLCTPTMKFMSSIQDHEGAFRDLSLVFPQMVAINNQWEIKARPVDASLTGQAKVCQEAIGWYGREIEYYLDLFGDCDVTLQQTASQTSCLSHVSALFSAPQLLLNNGLLPADVGTEITPLPVFDERTVLSTTSGYAPAEDLAPRRRETESSHPSSTAPSQSG